MTTPLNVTNEKPGGCFKQPSGQMILNGVKIILIVILEARFEVFRLQV